MTSFYFLSIISLLVLFFTSPVNALEIINLKPSKGNYVNLDKVEIIVYNKNFRKVAISGSKKPNSEPLYFSIIINPKDNTYKTEKKEISTTSKVYEIVKFNEKMKKARTSNTNNLVQTSSLWQYANIAMVTEDPPNLDLAIIPIKIRLGL